MDGIIVINKEEGYTSRDVVNKVGKVLKTKKIGHTGTLDPLATGVLVLCIGRATKLVDLITSEKKEYIASVILGISTDTLDITGKILKEEKVKIAKDKIIEVLNSFKGEYDQEVPLYSAVKINGKKLYEYARENIKINLPKRKVQIYSIELIDDIKYENDQTLFKIKCSVSKGTYIRSLIKDIALKLGVVGTMSALKRTKQGKFNIENSYKIKDIENNNYKILNIKEALTNFYEVKVDKKLENKILNGCILDDIYNKEYVLFTNSNEVIALYKKEDNKLKVFKMLKIKNNI